jgi:membrane protein DedA with SNARE-associated domain
MISTDNFTLVLIIISLISPFGISLGASFFIITAGSMSATFSDYVLVVIIVFLGFIIGDIAAYATGSYFEKKLTKRFCNNERYIKQCNASQAFFDKYGIASIFWTRFLILAFAATINYISGLSKYPFRKFLVAASLGELLYSAIYAYIGFAFKDSWVYLYEMMADFSFTIILFVAAFFALYKLRKYIENGFRHSSA